MFHWRGSHWQEVSFESGIDLVSNRQQAITLTIDVKITESYNNQLGPDSI